MKGVIPAGGKGTRLNPITLAVPKEMIRIGEKPVIEHVIDVLKASIHKDLTRSGASTPRSTIN